MEHKVTVRLDPGKPQSVNIPASLKALIDYANTKIGEPINISQVCRDAIQAECERILHLNYTHVLDNKRARRCTDHSVSRNAQCQGAATWYLWQADRWVCYYHLRRYHAGEPVERIPEDYYRGTVFEQFTARRAALALLTASEDDRQSDTERSTA